MSGELIHEWPTEKVCILRLNRPASYNALSRSLVDQLRAAVGTLPRSGAAALVLAANGPGFCTGADLKERRTMDDDEKYAHNRAINALANEIAGLPFVTIAAISGTALGGGCEIALACDIRFAASTAVIGLTEMRIGAMPGAGGTQRLPRLIGTARALEMMYSGEPITADKAAEWGLVNAVAEPDELLEHALSFARLVAKRSRHTAALLKSSVYRGIDRELAAGLEIERAAIVEILKSEDYEEGLAAFAERREPIFK